MPLRRVIAKVDAALFWNDPAQEVVVSDRGPFQAITKARLIRACAISEVASGQERQNWWAWEDGPYAALQRLGPGWEMTQAA